LLCLWRWWLPGAGFFIRVKKNSKKIFIIIAVVSLLYGIVMEIIQEQFIPNRSFEIADILSDGVGSFIGYIIAVRKYIKK
jgi:VanZ family protein